MKINEMEIRLFLVLVVTTIASGFLLPEQQSEGPGPEVYVRIDPNDDFEWIKFKRTYNKTYSNVREDTARRLKWAENVNFVNKHNEEFLRGDHSFWVGIQAHSDMSQKEFVDTMQGVILPKEGVEVYPPALEEVDPSIPNFVDWISLGYVNPVENQGSCGSCWAFSATGALEGQNMRFQRTLPDLSKQNLVDCTLTNSGCQGGWMNNAFTYVRNQGGIDGEFCYPYTGRQSTCRYDSACKESYDRGYQNVGRSEASLQTAVATIGPISFACDATSTEFSHYRGGVFDYPACRTNVASHAMVITGYGRSGVDYWNVKNSYGTGWGDRGYIKMRRNGNNQCGIANWASYPVL